MKLVPGTDIMGYSYNVFGKYASKASAGIKVVKDVETTPITIGDKTYDLPVGLTTMTVSNSKAKNVIGEDFENYTQALNVTLGLEGRYGYFSGSLNSAYSQEVRNSLKTMYSTISENVQSFDVRYPDPSKLSLTPEFVKDLAKMEPDDLYSKYGSHIVTGIQVGGNAQFSSYAQETKSYTEQDFKVDVEASYMKATGSSSFEGNQSSETQSNVQKADFDVTGGTTEGQSALVNDQDWDAWMTTVDDEPELVGFIPEIGLTPIYVYAAKVKRKQVLSDAFDRLHTPLRSNNESKVVKTEGSPSKHKTVTNKSNDNFEFAVGIGVKLTNQQVNNLAVCYENTQTGIREWRAVDVDSQSKDFNPKNYDQIDEVPRGAGMTGLAAREKDNKMKNMRLDYQVVDRGESRNGGSALASEVASMFLNNPRDSYEIDFKPSENNRKVISGVSMSYNHNKGTMSGLTLELSDFKLPASN